MFISRRKIWLLGVLAVVACSVWLVTTSAADQIYISNAKSNARLFFVGEDQEGQLIAIDRRYQNIFVWNRSQPGNPLNTIEIEDYPESAYYSENDSKLYIASVGKVLSSEYPFNEWKTLLTHQMHAMAIAIDESEKTLLIGFGDRHFLEEDAEKQEEGALQLFDLKTNETILSTETADVVRCVAISGDGQLIAYVDNKDDVVVADHKGRELSRIECEAQKLYFSPNAEYLSILNGNFGHVLLWDVQKEKSVGRSHQNNNQSVPFDCPFSPDGKYLFVGGQRTTKFFNSTVGELGVYSIPDMKPLAIHDDVALPFGFNAILALDVSANGKEVFAITGGGNVKSWNVESLLKKE